jgi:hypothetical protein
MKTDEIEMWLRTTAMDVYLQFCMQQPLIAVSMVRWLGVVWHEADGRPHRGRRR